LSDFDLNSRSDEIDPLTNKESPQQVCGDFFKLYIEKASPKIVDDFCLNVYYVNKLIGMEAGVLLGD